MTALANFLLAIGKTITRLLAFIGRELVEVRRRPGVLASLVFGPFLVMAVFGLGYSGYRKPLPTILVIPPQSGLPTDVASYQQVAGRFLEVVAIVPDEDQATQRLAQGDVEVVAVAPANAKEQFQNGKQSEIQVKIDIADPVQ